MVMRVFALHEYELRNGMDPAEFESVLKDAITSRDLDLPGLESRHFLKGYKSERQGKYAVLWIFESQKALEDLFGTEEAAEDGPENFVNFEKNVLATYLDRPPHMIVYTDYWELIGRSSK